MNAPGSANAPDSVNAPGSVDAPDSVNAPDSVPSQAVPAQNAAAPQGVVKATCRGLWYGKPPLKEHFFDVTLRNPAPEPRWLVLPGTFPYAGSTEPAPGGEEIELQPFVIGKRPRVVIVKGVGGNFWAVRLPGGGRLTLRKLVIESWWETVPASVDLEVIIAREVTIGGTALAALVSADSMSESGADVLAPADAAAPGGLPFWHPTSSAAPVVFDIESRARVAVPLGSKECGLPSRAIRQQSPDM